MLTMCTVEKDICTRCHLTITIFDASITFIGKRKTRTYCVLCWQQTRARLLRFFSKHMKFPEARVHLASLYSEEKPLLTPLAAL